MNQISYITTSFDRPELIEDMVEKLASHHYFTGHGKTDLPEPLQGLFEVIDTSTIENYVNGTMEFSFDEEEDLRLPFVTSFLFTCINEGNDPYKLNWGLSLS